MLLRLSNLSVFVLILESYRDRWAKRSGKSTIMKLLPRLYNLEDGVIRIDDYDIQKVDLDSLRQQIGIVPQDSMLLMVAFVTILP